MKPGDIVQSNRNIFVVNTGNTNLHYWFFGSCIPVHPSTHEEAVKAVSALYAVVKKFNNKNSDYVYIGPLSELSEEYFEGRFLPPYGTERLQLFLSLPVITDIPESATVKVSLRFVSKQA